GTFGYAASEVMRGLPLAVATDLYAMGATLFVLAMTVARGADVTHANPVRPPKDSAAAAVALEEAGVTPGLSHLIVRLPAPAPESRRGSAREVRRELARLHPAARRSLHERLRTDLLVGRANELASLQRWLATPDEPPVLLLAGAPGVGKSTLLREL